MCGRFVLDEDGKRLMDQFKLRYLPDDLRPRYNIPPGQPILTVRDVDRTRSSAMLKWGLVPFWSKDPKIGYKLNNARSETAAEKPSFRAAFKSRRCIIPASGFYEWKRDGNVKVPHFIQLRSGEPMGFAGLWETWRPRGHDDELQTCTILTTGPNEVMAQIHDRMPVILSPEDYEDWLDADAEKDFLRALMVPYNAKEMRAHPVSTRVNSARNDGPELVEAV